MHVNLEWLQQFGFLDMYMCTYRFACICNYVCPLHVQCILHSCKKHWLVVIYGYKWLLITM